MKKHEWFVFSNIFLILTQEEKKNKKKNEKKNRFPEVLVTFAVEKKTYYECSAYSLIHRLSH